MLTNTSTMKTSQSIVDEEETSQTSASLGQNISPEVMDEKGLVWSETRTSRIGESYQVSVLPCPSNFPAGSDDYPAPEMIWDPSMAKLQGANDFIHTYIASCMKESAMEMLHKKKYNVHGLMRDLDVITPMDGSDWTIDEHDTFRKLMQEKKHDVVVVSKCMGKSVSNCLNVYYKIINVRETRSSRKRYDGTRHLEAPWEMKYGWQAPVITTRKENKKKDAKPNPNTNSEVKKRRSSRRSLSAAPSNPPSEIEKQNSRRTSGKGHHQKLEEIHSFNDIRVVKNKHFVAAEKKSGADLGAEPAVGKTCINAELGRTSSPTRRTRSSIRILSTEHRQEQKIAPASKKESKKAADKKQNSKADTRRKFKKMSPTPANKPSDKPGTELMSATASKRLVRASSRIAEDTSANSTQTGTTKKSSDPGSNKADEKLGTAVINGTTMRQTRTSRRIASETSTDRGVVQKAAPKAPRSRKRSVEKAGMELTSATTKRQTRNSTRKTHDPKQDSRAVETSETIAQQNLGIGQEKHVKALEAKIEAKKILKEESNSPENLALKESPRSVRRSRRNFSPDALEQPSKKSENISLQTEEDAKKHVILRRSSRVSSETNIPQQGTSKNRETEPKCRMIRPSRKRNDGTNLKKEHEAEAAKINELHITRQGKSKNREAETQTKITGASRKKNNNINLKNDHDAEAAKINEPHMTPRRISPRLSNNLEQHKTNPTNSATSQDSNPRRVSMRRKASMDVKPKDHKKPRSTKPTLSPSLRERPRRKVQIKEEEIPSKPRKQTRPTPQPTAQNHGPVESTKKTKSRKSDPDEVFEEKFAMMLKYKKEHGHCYVPKVYPENQSLSYWVFRLRGLYKERTSKRKHNRLTDERIKRLEDIGFAFWVKNSKEQLEIESLRRKPKDDAKWNNYFAKLKEYKKEHGHCLVPKCYPENQALSTWVFGQRQQKRNWDRKEPCRLTEERIKELEDLGFVWQAKRNREWQEVDRLRKQALVEDAWQAHYRSLVSFKRKNGHTRVPKSYAQNQTLSSWVFRQRSFHKKMLAGELHSLTPSRLEQLQNVSTTYL